jgi:chaperone modulatory protein CbpM
MQLEVVASLFPDTSVIEITTWVERGWVQPESSDAGWVFHEIDVARVRLIRELRRDLDLDDDVLPVVLSLMDQVYELRRTLKGVLGVVGRQPADVQQAVLAVLDRPLPK